MFLEDEPLRTLPPRLMSMRGRVNSDDNFVRTIPSTYVPVRALNNDSSQRPGHIWGRSVSRLSTPAYVGRPGAAFAPLLRIAQHATAETARMAALTCISELARGSRAQQCDLAQGVVQVFGEIGGRLPPAAEALLRGLFTADELAAFAAGHCCDCLVPGPACDVVWGAFGEPPSVADVLALGRSAELLRAEAAAVHGLAREDVLLHTYSYDALVASNTPLGWAHAFTYIQLALTGDLPERSPTAHLHLFPRTPAFYLALILRDLRQEDDGEMSGDGEEAEVTGIPFGRHAAAGEGSATGSPPAAPPALATCPEDLAHLDAATEMVLTQHFPRTVTATFPDRCVVFALLRWRASHTGPGANTDRILRTMLTAAPPTRGVAGGFPPTLAVELRARTLVLPTTSDERQESRIVCCSVCLVDFAGTTAVAGCGPVPESRHFLCLACSRRIPGRCPVCRAENRRLGILIAAEGELAAGPTKGA